MKPLLLVHECCGWRCIAKTFISRPKLCPKCGTRTDGTSMYTFFLPDPFVSSSATAGAGGNGCCCIFLKPSTGSFNRYKLGDNLHIGLSNSKGSVFSYTEYGLIVESPWENCICIYRFNDSEKCDTQMKTFIKQYRNRFTPKYYDGKNWNCYDFVVEFLLYTGVLKERNRLVKDEFVSQYVCKALQRVLRYYSLLDRLSRLRTNCITLS